MGLFQKPVAVCEFSASHVRVAHMVRCRQAPYADVVGLAEGATGGVWDGRFTKLAEAAESLWEVSSEAGRQSGLGLQNLFLSLEDPFLESVKVRGTAYLDGFTEAFGSRHIREARNRAFQALKPLDKHPVYENVAGYLIDGRDYLHNPMGICGKELTVVLHLLFSESSQAQNLRSVAERAGFEPAGIFPAALAAACGVLDEKQMARRQAVVLAGERVCHLSSVEHQAIQEHRAVMVNRGYGADERELILSELRQITEVKPEAVWITGECAAGEGGAAEWLSADGIPARLAGPRIKHEKLISPSYAVVTGLYALARSHPRHPERFKSARLLWADTHSRVRSFLEEYF